MLYNRKLESNNGKGNKKYFLKRHVIYLQVDKLYQKGRTSLHFMFQNPLSHHAGAYLDKLGV